MILAPAVLLAKNGEAEEKTKVVMMLIRAYMLLFENVLLWWAMCVKMFIMNIIDALLPRAEGSDF